MKKYVCAVCGYIYDPARGDKAHGILAGVAFDALPGSWHCPVCGVTKGDFSPW
ncbi:MAG: rubredoxin [Nitrospirae bacterium]|uniref:rubredoxin n=1 Tax=Candidatus Magnetobacterium casense TaxID=1455061 RepID=UPI0009DE136E|nr:rubredoxin [Candidatus Magnetobacterium casensis]MBF0337699.1 rubredoxin [Nitrospirota bacterium]